MKASLLFLLIFTLIGSFFVGGWLLFNWLVDAGYTLPSPPINPIP